MSQCAPVSLPLLEIIPNYGPIMYQSFAMEAQLADAGSIEPWEMGV